MPLLLIVILNSVMNTSLGNFSQSKSQVAFKYFYSAVQRHVFIKANLSQFSSKINFRKFKQENRREVKI